jgi:hypothetical protein
LRYRNAECRYADYYYADCHDTECHDAVTYTPLNKYFILSPHTIH